MKLINAIFLILLAGLSACKKDNTKSPNNKMPDSYKGVYIIESAIMNLSGDLNGDGIISNDFLLEVKELRHSDVNIVAENSSSTFSFIWPEAHAVPENQPEVYNYNRKRYIYNLEFSSNQDKIIIAEQNDKDRLMAPYDIEIVGDELTFRLDRTVYINSEKKNVVIRASYKKDDYIIE